MEFGLLLLLLLLLLLMMMGDDDVDDDEEDDDDDKDDDNNGDVDDHDDVVMKCRIPLKETWEKLFSLFSSWSLSPLLFGTHWLGGTGKEQEVVTSFNLL